jgi:putative transcriptional regulator
MLSKLDFLLSKLYIGAMKIRHDIQNHVRQHRVLGGLTQQALADRVGVTRQTILFIEKGKYTPSVALALLLARVLDATVETLFQLNEGERND